MPKIFKCNNFTARLLKLKNKLKNSSSDAIKSLFNLNKVPWRNEENAQVS